MADGNSTSSAVVFFGTTAVTGPWSDWVLQSGASPAISRQSAQSLKQDGDQLRATQYGTQASYTENYVAATITGNTGLTIPNVGAISGGAHVDSVTVTYSQTASPTMAVSSHKHANASGTLQTHGTCRTYAGTVTLPARAIGVPSTLSAGGTTVFTAPSGIGMRSLVYTLSVTHLDEPDGDGNQLAGENRDGVEELKIEFTGKVVTSELSISSDWVIESDADSEGNTAATTKSITLTKHLAHTTTTT